MNKIKKTFAVCTLPEPRAATHVCLWGLVPCPCPVPVTLTLLLTSGPSSLLHRGKSCASCSFGLESFFSPSWFFFPSFQFIRRIHRDDDILTPSFRLFAQFLIATWRLHFHFQFLPFVKPQSHQVHTTSCCLHWVLGSAAGSRRLDSQREEATVDEVNGSKQKL